MTSMTQSAKRLTALQVLPALESGGVERGVLEIAEALVDQGHRSLVISAGGRMVRELVDRGSEHFACPIGTKSPLTLRWIPWLRKLLIRERVDVIDIHSRLPGWIAWLAWKSLPPARRPRLISTLHGLHSVSAYSGIMCCGETVIVVSETVRQYVLQNFPHVPADKLRLIHRGIEDVEYPRGYQPPSSWKDSFFGEFPHLREQPLITLPGRITRLKGHHDFLQLLVNLKDAGVPAHGLIVGGAEPSKTDYLEEIRRLVQERGLQDRVTFTGHRTDLKQIYSISRVVVSLSKTPESFGRTVAEALSIGTPVVAYNHGGVAEILAAEFPEGAIDEGDLAGLTRRVQSLLVQQSPVVIAPNRFPKKDMLQKTLDVYAEICHARQRAAA